PASTTGFWVEELPPQRRYYKVVSGKKYMVTEIYNALFPTSSGEYTIGPAELKCIPDIFEDPFSLFYGGIRKKPFILKTRPIKITVNPLPSKNIPPDFKGAIGIYTIEATLDKINTKENEPVTLKIIISGTGNIKTVNDIELPSEIDRYFKQYKTNSLINISKKNYRVYGEKILEFILVPVKSGEISIPSIKFTYFNPEIGRYVDTQTPMFKLNVSPGIKIGDNDDENKEKNLPLSIGITKEDLKRLGKDIRYIKSSPNPHGNECDYLYSNPAFITIQILPLLLLFGIIGYRKSSEKMETDIRFARAKKAHKFAKNQLKQAGKFLEENRAREYYAELTRTIQNYLGNKLNLPPASITQESVKNELFAKGINDSVINEIISCFDKFDLARFAPCELNLEEMKEMYNSVQNIIISIEKYL
ncbi:BatD family protein, partial [Candidatus Desantisbacteria bacterium]|nr:BatD family protein [Candidatus Desantisbacteria bacterium]